MISFDLLPNTMGNSLGSALLILVCNISDKLILEPVVFWFLVSSNHDASLKKKRNFFAPLANTESKNLKSALFHLYSDITKKLAYKSGVIWC